MATRDEVLKIAQLARIRIPDSESESVQQKISAILEHFKDLQEVDTSQVEPLFHGIEKMQLRADTPEPALDREALLANAPEQLENCFRIPLVVGGEE